MWRLRVLARVKPLKALVHLSAVKCVSDQREVQVPSPTAAAKAAVPAARVAHMAVHAIEVDLAQGSENHVQTAAATSIEWITRDVNSQPAAKPQSPAKSPIILPRYSRILRSWALVEGDLASCISTASALMSKGLSRYLFPPCCLSNARCRTSLRPLSIVRHLFLFPSMRHLPEGKPKTSPSHS